ncbi:MAG: DUF1854 domain-containing protein [Lachnospiraceae bacterium]|nr:DUF1854 domain-containing protein [Lachnospiraceae bacterium]
MRPPMGPPPGGPGGHGGRRRPPMEDFDESKFLEQSKDLLELRYIDDKNAVFKRTEGGFVSLDYTDKEGNVQHYDRVGVYRTFPMSNPDIFISIREPDEKAREIGVVKDLKEIAKETADILREQLDLRYFVPQVERIIDVKSEYGYAYFDVVTDFGNCRFAIHMSGGGVVHLTDTRIMITDIDGNRFEIKDVSKLSSAELKKIDLFL